MLTSVYERDYTPRSSKDPLKTFRTKDELVRHIRDLQAEMRTAADNLDFERASEIRDEVAELSRSELGAAESN